MKLTALFLFIVLVIAINAIIESVMNIFNNDELSEALKQQHMTYVWTDLTYGALR